MDIGQKNGVELEYEPEYGGASYLEKQDYIIENQQKRIAKMPCITFWGLKSVIIPMKC